MIQLLLCQRKWKVFLHSVMWGAKMQRARLTLASSKIRSWQCIIIIKSNRWVGCNLNFMRLSYIKA